MHQPHYAVIFTSSRTAMEHEQYDAMATRMVELAGQQPGFLGIECVRDSDGSGITVSYWQDLESIKAWKNVAEHREAQRLGREKWYRSFRLRICRIEDEYSFDAEE
ncbi:MAG: antibiotic biosynthesis monooxygenase family protein [Planctomycetota bacterium]|jgi:heme-degrading monooxygenase HmoA